MRDVAPVSLYEDGGKRPTVAEVALGALALMLWVTLAVYAAQGRVIV